ncbi:pseudouridine synthase [Edaphobacillus lindanitolerans]|uniref:Pseudouridine synthase n=1 Tax=Edaphobacillus lindanitolerans TaxID=550447 RepID=A0A1U7PQX5_9BACI|nr:pseudouridine synthase [Edaphobacillus lindanitolerans]SIT85521.1 ribosomal small subunit pseudouridine synthase A [Edaphobacillus lindanitolerans]
MRLDKLLANSGYGSRKEVKLLLKQGAVSVGGETVRDPKLHVDPDADSVTVFGDPVDYREFVYIMMNKPPGVVSATDDNRDRTVIDLLPDEYRRFEPFPAGRLDKDTEGLLLITNDGKLAHELLSPKRHVGKTYYAKVDGEVTAADAEAFTAGVELEDGYVTKPAVLEILSAGPVSDIELTITEGKFHQVKRMFESRGKQVVYLKRLTMGPLRLDPELALGGFRELTDEELNELKSHKKG